MKEMKRVLSLVLCLMMLVTMMPVTALTAFAAEGTPTVVIAGSDYQASSSATTMQNIMNQIKEDYSSVYGILMGGDYDAGDVYTNASHLTAVDTTISSVYPGIADEYRIMIQGNHETYGNLSPSTNDLLDATRGTPLERVVHVNILRSMTPITMASMPSTMRTLTALPAVWSPTWTARTAIPSLSSSCPTSPCIRRAAATMMRLSICSMC